MDNLILIILASAGVLSAVLFIIHWRRKKKYYLNTPRIRPKVSIVIVTKNNESLVQQVLEQVQEVQGLIDEIATLDEIIIFDLNSIDRTVEVARNVLGSNPKSKVLSPGEITVTPDYLSMAKRVASSETVFLLDLNRISMSNPNVYVPDLFLPLCILKGMKMHFADDRIDGTKLLYFDKVEREKNGFVMTEHVIETLANLRMRLESFGERIRSNPLVINTQVSDMLYYIDRIIVDNTQLLRLIGPIKVSGQTLDENLLELFNGYAQSHRILVEYKVTGSRKVFKDEIAGMLVGICQDVLIVCVEHTLSAGLEVSIRYGNGQFLLLFKFDWVGDVKRLLAAESGLSYYVLHSVQNRLSLVGGGIRLKVKAGGELNLMIKIPLDQTTCRGV